MTRASRIWMTCVLEWRLVGRGLDNPQILAHDGRGGVLAINRVLSLRQLDQWWLTGQITSLGPFTTQRLKRRALPSIGQTPASACSGLAVGLESPADVLAAYSWIVHPQRVCEVGDRPAAARAAIEGVNRVAHGPCARRSLVRENCGVRRATHRAVNAALLFAFLAFPVMVIILAVQGDWGPAAIVGVVWLMTWWRSSHGGRFVPASLRDRWRS